MGNLKNYYKAEDYFNANLNDVYGHEKVEIENFIRDLKSCKTRKQQEQILRSRRTNSATCNLDERIFGIYSEATIDSRYYGYYDENGNETNKNDIEQVYQQFIVSDELLEQILSKYPLGNSKINTNTSFSSNKVYTPTFSDFLLSLPFKMLGGIYNKFPRFFNYILLKIIYFIIWAILYLAIISKIRFFISHVVLGMIFAVIIVVLLSKFLNKKFDFRDKIINFHDRF